MAGLLEVEVSLHGQIANAANMTAKAEKAVMAGLLELATIEGQVVVQKHIEDDVKKFTGHLFKHIGAAKVGPLTAQFDAGQNRYGKNLIYSYWIEGSSPKNVSSSFKGYKMFDKAYQRLATKPNLWKRYVGMHMMRAFR